MLTAEDLNNIQVLLKRVDMKGEEAMTVASIQLKLQSMINQIKEQEPKEEKEE